MNTDQSSNVIAFFSFAATALNLGLAAYVLYKPMMVIDGVASVFFAVYII